jgi:predicted TIM-barrel fold metal-dependent hydrolase
LYQDREQYDQAQVLYQRALAVFEKVFGSDHPHTLLVSANYADLVLLQKETGEQSACETKETTYSFVDTKLKNLQNTSQIKRSILKRK